MFWDRALPRLALNSSMLLPLLWNLCIGIMELEKQLIANSLLSWIQLFTLCWDYRHKSPHPVFCMDAGVPNSGLIFIGQTLHPLKHLPSQVYPNIGEEESTHTSRAGPSGWNLLHNWTRILKVLSILVHSILFQNTSSAHSLDLLLLCLV